MSIPLDRLYQFLTDVAQQDILIYRFIPHGSIKWDDLKPLLEPNKWQQKNFIPAVCHDQDPVNVNYIPKVPDFLRRILRDKEFQNRTMIFVHSQKKLDIEKFKMYDAVPVYYWSHALIALDWYRYASIDPKIKPNDKIKSKMFLIYNRAWSGYREYRLKFLELVVVNGLIKNCRTKFSAIDNGIHYTKHFYSNSKFQINCNLETLFEPNTTDSCASADYVIEDYLNTNIEIILETVFDESYWHLTEKTLRSIAIGHPFILVSTPGSLEYLRSYGFKTFSPWIDETYDTIQDPLERLQAVVDEMQRIAKLNIDQQQEILIQCRVISEYNRARFFSKDFFFQVVNEFQTNLMQALSTIKQSQRV